MRTTTILCALATMLLSAWTASAREYRDTLYSQDGDRIIIDYTVSTAQGGKSTLTIDGVQKRLSNNNRRKYKNLEEVSVAFFDRTGTYGDVKFEGTTPQAFMVPAGVSYTASADGYFLMQDCPPLSMQAQQETTVSIPLYLVNYRKSRHYTIFATCGTLSVTIGGKPTAGGGAARTQRGGATQEVIEGEELLEEEGLSPADDARLTIQNVRASLEAATTLPFSEDLTYQANHLRELRSRVSDMDIQQQINSTLAAYDQKQAALQQQAEARQQAQRDQEKAEADSTRKAEQAQIEARQAAAEKKADEKQRTMMWVGGGIALLMLLFMGGKQIVQMVKQNKMQKQVMEQITKAQQQALGNVNIPGVDPNNPMARDINQQLQRNARKTLTKEGEAARQKLQQMKSGNKEQPDKPAQPSTATTATATPQPKKPSLNDVIPKHYKRWRKPGTPDGGNNVTI